jgi:hypothetical protein
MNPTEATIMFRLLLALCTLAAPIWAQARIEVTRAVYGAVGAEADVTERVRSFVVNGGIHIQVNPATLGADPAPNVPKYLFVEYRQGLFRRNTRVQDNGFLRLGNSPAQPTPPPATLRITKALYGDGRRMKDVTDILNARIAANQLELPITNDNLGGDPAPAVKKNIVVEYSWNNAPATLTIAEGDTLRLPPGGAVSPAPGSNVTAVVPSSSTLRVLRATYGEGPRFRDVTGAVSSAAASGRIAIRVDPTALGGDPAPGVVKTLSVEYMENGVRRTASARDGEMLRVNSAPELKILQATYGAAETTRRRDRRDRRPSTRDVTGAVAAKVADGELALIVDPAALGGDPAPGVIKSLTVQYELDGQRLSASAKDAELLAIPPVTSLTIAAATYGVPGRSLDATAALQRRLANNRLEVVVNDVNLGGDPAPGIVKTLTVQYDRNGRRRVATAVDGETLRLPGAASSAPVSGPAGNSTSPAPITASPVSVTPQPGQDAVRGRGACLYRLPNYAGEALCLSSASAMAVIGAWQSGFRSVRLNGAAAVDLFELPNYAGRSQSVTQDTPDLMQLPSTWWRYEEAAPIQSFRSR